MAWLATRAACRTVLVTTARSRPALRLAVASGVDLAAAIDAFLSQPDLAPTTRAKYRQTLAVLEDELADAPMTGAGLAGVVAQRWHHASPATWNRHVGVSTTSSRRTTLSVSRRVASAPPEACADAGQSVDR
jgi:hypothetical protein